jgi:hypothetical protein
MPSGRLSVCCASMIERFQFEDMLIVNERNRDLSTTILKRSRRTKRTLLINQLAPTERARSKRCARGRALVSRQIGSRRSPRRPFLDTSGLPTTRELPRWRDAEALHRHAFDGTEHIALAGHRNCRCAGSPTWVGHASRNTSVTSNTGFRANTRKAPRYNEVSRIL